VASSWGSSWGTSWGISWGDTGGVTPTPTPVTDKIWPWASRENRRDRKRRLEAEEYERLLREEAEALVAEAVADDGADALLKDRKSLRELLLTAPVLDEPRPVGKSAADITKMVAQIQRDMVATLKRIQDDEDDDEAALLLLM
jgi:hypothetical protein